jgi:hypothetical protein
MGRQSQTIMYKDDLVLVASAEAPVGRITAALPA